MIRLVSQGIHIGRVYLGWYRVPKGWRKLGISHDQTPEPFNSFRGTWLDCWHITLVILVTKRRPTS